MKKQNSSATVPHPSQKSRKPTEAIFPTATREVGQTVFLAFFDVNNPECSTVHEDTIEKWDQNDTLNAYGVMKIRGVWKGRQVFSTWGEAQSYLVQSAYRQIGIIEMRKAKMVETANRLIQEGASHR